MKILRKSLIIIFLIFLACSCSILTISAISIDIKISDSFFPGDKIYFSYMIKSDINQQIKFVQHISCPTAPVEFLQEQKIYLQANIPFQGAYRDFQVNENLESQTCAAYIQIISPFQQRVEKNFSIITNPSFDFKIKLDKKIFNLGENIKIKYDSSVSNPQINAKLTYPDSKSIDINLPYEFKADKIGTYSLDITASKQGYKTITKKEKFGVIGKNAEVKSIQKPNLVNYVYSDSIKRQYYLNSIKNNIGIYLILFALAIMLILFVLTPILKKYMKKGRTKNHRKR